MRKWTINQFNRVRSTWSHKWFISNTLDESHSEYLHSDLVVRNSTRNGNVFSGYFDTKEEAEHTLTKYLEQP